MWSGIKVEPGVDDLVFLVLSKGSLSFWKATRLLIAL